MKLLFHAVSVLFFHALSQYYPRSTLFRPRGHACASVRSRLDINQHHPSSPCIDCSCPAFSTAHHHASPLAPRSWICEMFRRREQGAEHLSEICRTRPSPPTTKTARLESYRCVMLFSLFLLQNSLVLRCAQTFEHS